MAAPTEPAPMIAIDPLEADILVWWTVFLQEKGSRYVFQRSGEAGKAVTRERALPAGHMQAQLARLQQAPV